MADLLDVLLNIVKGSNQNTGNKYFEPPNAADAYSMPRPTASTQPVNTPTTQIPDSVRGIKLDPITVVGNQAPSSIPSKVPDLNKNGGLNFGDLLARLGIPLGAAIAGSVNPDMLPAASGLATGYASGITKSDEMNIEKEKIQYERKKSEDKIDKEKMDDAYKLAVDLSKTGPFGQIKELNPQQVDDLARRIYEIRAKTTKEISKEVKESVFDDKEAPDPNKYKEGSILKDSNGNPVAILKGGKWVNSQ